MNSYLKTRTRMGRGCILSGKSFATLMALFLSITLAIAQQRTIRGTVHDSQGNAIIGANILVAESNTGTITNSDGQFVLEIDNQAKTL